jgi:hypothetical protein
MSDTVAIIITIFGAGCLGGLTNAAIADELKLPYRDNEARVYHPGWVGNVLVGAVASLVFWGLYGPMAAAIVIGPELSGGPIVALKVSELFGAVLAGIGGGRLLTAEVDKRLAKEEIGALTRAKNDLASAVTGLAQVVTK